MTKAQRTAIEAYGRKGCSPGMIAKLMARAGLVIKPAEIKEVLSATVIEVVNENTTHRQFHVTDMELQRYSDPEELRARWLKLLPKMKSRLRAEIAVFP
jgi:hypothetical protein